MSAGQKNKGQETLNCLRGLPAANKRNGFTIVEVLVTVSILLIIIAPLPFILNITNLSSAVSGAKLDVQQEVRRAMDLIVRDLRQTGRMKLSVVNNLGNTVDFNLVGNDDTFTNPLFNVCTGFSGGNITWSSNQIGYSFDAVNDIITRTDSDTPQVWRMNNITNLEFRKISLNLLRITINGEKTARGAISPGFTLQEEVRLRN